MLGRGQKSGLGITSEDLRQGSVLYIIPKSRKLPLPAIQYQRVSTIHIKIYQVPSMNLLRRIIRGDNPSNISLIIIIGGLRNRKDIKTRR
jgi:hypothetical protein